MTEYISWYKLTSSFIYRKSACPNSSRTWLKKKSLGLTTFEWKILFINRPYLVKHLSTYTTTFMTVPAKLIQISCSKFQIIPITHVKYILKKKNKTRIHILLQSLISETHFWFVIATRKSNYDDRNHLHKMVFPVESEIQICSR